MDRSRTVKLAEVGDVGAAVELLRDGRRRGDVESALMACEVLVRACTCEWCRGRPLRTNDHAEAILPGNHSGRLGEIEQVYPWRGPISHTSWDINENSTTVRISHVECAACEKCGRVNRTHTPAVRAALLWSVSDLNALVPGTAYCGSRLRGEESCGDGSCLGADGGCVYWESARDDLAERIANLARLLPNPQPMGKPMLCRHGSPVDFDCTNSCKHCRGKGRLPDIIGTRPCSRCRGKGFTLSCSVCGMTNQDPTPGERVHVQGDLPAPTHALRLYVAALKLAQGEADDTPGASVTHWRHWFGWLVRKLDNASESQDVANKCAWVLCDSGARFHGRTCLAWVQEHNRQLNSQGPVIYADGTIECGPECPPLPEVK